VLDGYRLKWNEQLHTAKGRAICPAFWTEKLSIAELSWISLS